MLNQRVGTAREWYLAEILVSLYLLQVIVSGISTCPTFVSPLFPGPPLLLPNFSQSRMMPDIVEYL